MTFTETATNQPWRRNRKTAIHLAIFLGAWTWIYTYRRDAWKATLGLHLQFTVIFGMLFTWLILKNIFFFMPQTGGNVSNNSQDWIFDIMLAFMMISGACVFLGVQTWAIIDSAKAKVWELSEPKGRSKTAAILFAIFLSYMTWLYTYPKDYKKFWVGVGLTVAYYISYFIWFNPLQIFSSQVFSEDFLITSVATSVSGGVIWIIGIVLAAVRNGEWYKQAGQKTKPAGFRQYT